MIALLAQGRYQIVAGGISAGYFNALEKNLPITIAVDRVSTPIGHNLMLRPDLKDTIKSLKDLKGKVDRQQRPGLGLDLRGRQDAGDATGLTIADVELKIFPFTADGDRLHQQGDRRRHRDSAVHLAARGAGTRDPVRRASTNWSSRSR